ncbi:PRC-barrel domain-containing protein [Pyrococcus kukulkanii]|uniref:PRC-barrel domain-containing protein n=1 Tax=Pyrococcus kukulkanii TaxID=1609559 RepID=A0A127BBW3_9EURY|nr:PRC-barrel domain-containing protein [Pyrococcus kukulkanii]AMM54824.1 photosystem reaction center subunit H [Pyrococcus kukulkanii]
MVRIRASKLRDVELITDTGVRLGWVYDILFDEDGSQGEKGEILAILADPDEDLDLSSFVVTEDGLLVIPMRAVKSIGEVIVVDSNELAKVARK